MTVDPFDDADPGDPLQRDQWGRPIILRPDRPDGQCPQVKYCRIKAGHGHYTRASTFCSWLDDGMGLSTWRARHVALSVARAAPSTRAMLAGCHYPERDNPCPELDEWIESALEQGKRDEHASLLAADWGTAMHRFTEPDSPPHAPERLVSDIAAFQRETSERGWMILDTELFVVNDELEVAGTLDVIFGAMDGAYIIADKKTGTIHPLSHSIQVAVYASSVRYYPRTGERTAIDARSPCPSIPHRGVIMHLPLGAGRCEILEVDLPRALDMARLAAQVGHARKTAPALLRGWPRTEPTTTEENAK